LVIKLIIKFAQFLLYHFNEYRERNTQRPCLINNHIAKVSASITRADFQAGSDPRISWPENERLNFGIYLPRWRCDLSDFHETATDLRGKEARILPAENAGYIIDHGGRRLGLERRQFDYSHYYPERRVGLARRTLPERRIDSKLNS
jgi:hypothetical protein